MSGGSKYARHADFCQNPQHIGHQQIRRYKSVSTEHTAASQAHVTDWLAAFAAHPRIGDLNQLKAKYSQFAKLSETEQASAATASGDVLQVHIGLFGPTASLQLLVVRGC